MLRRTLLAAGCTLATTRLARAHDPQPARNDLTLLIGATPGSATDLRARVFAPLLARHMPRAEITLVNLPGQSGLAALGRLADSAADGSVLAWVTTPSLPAHVADRASVALVRRLSFLGAVQREPVAIVTPADTPLATVEGLFRRVTDDAQAPLGTPPMGSAAWLAALRLQRLAGRSLEILAFPSAAAARQAVLAGNVAAAAMPLGDVIGDLRESQLTCLALATDERLSALPDTPILAEFGFNLNAPILRGFVAPAGLPAGALGRLEAAFEATVSDPDYAAAADASGFQPRWLDGTHWLAQAQAEQDELARAHPALPPVAGPG